MQRSSSGFAVKVLGFLPGSSSFFHFLLSVVLRGFGTVNVVRAVAYAPLDYDSDSPRRSSRDAEPLTKVKASVLHQNALNDTTVRESEIECEKARECARKREREAQAAEQGSSTDGRAFAC